MHIHKGRLSSMAMAGFVFWGAACGGDDDDDKPNANEERADPQLIQMATDHARECKLEVSDGADEITIEDEHDRCAVQCSIAASCEELVEGICSLEEIDTQSALAACIEQCPEAPQDGFVCGDSARIPHAFVCDGNTDCEDGKDESDCEEFTCQGGGTVLATTVCDGFEDCDDGSDEADCSDPCATVDNNVSDR